MIHRALMGSLERFMGVLIEHYAGAFPTWLAPVQVEVMSISEKHVGYARKIYDILIDRGIRAKLNIENEKIGYKIRQSTIEKVPYMLILGDKEAETNKITVRRRNGENFELIDPEKFIEFITNEIKTKKQNLEVVK
jgi:threonyl-tRNA synthetase